MFIIFYITHILHIFTQVIAIHLDFIANKLIFLSWDVVNHFRKKNGISRRLLLDKIIKIFT